MAEPTWVSAVPDTVDISTALKGAEAQRLPLLPQGETVARVLEARDEDGCPLFPTVGILMPRRSTKTTSIWNVILGRCLLNPGHRVVTTAQDGNRARRRFRAVARTLEAGGFEEQGLGRIYWGNGDERIEFANGSELWVVAPAAGAFRSEAADTMLFDEAGELNLEKSEDLLEGALPLLDTRPMGQAIIAGTPAKVRAGLLWDTLQDGRDGGPGTGIVDYSIRDDEESVLYPDGEGSEPVLNEAVLRRVHPGIGTLTTMAKMRARFAKMSLPSFEREYLCRFPFNESTSAIDPAAWTAATVVEVPLPDRFGVAYDVAPDDSSAAVCAAWRDADGVAYVTILEHRAGVSWLWRTAHAIGRKYRLPIRYDAIGANHGPATDITRQRGVNVVPSTSKDAQAAAQKFVSELTNDRLRHFGQASFQEAVTAATWRQGEGGRYFGRRNGDITPLVAGALALFQFDQAGERKAMTVVTGRAS